MLVRVACTAFWEMTITEALSRNLILTLALPLNLSIAIAQAVQHYLQHVLELPLPPHLKDDPEAEKKPPNRLRPQLKSSLPTGALNNTRKEPKAQVASSYVVPNAARPSQMCDCSSIRSFGFAGCFVS